MKNIFENIILITYTQLSDALENKEGNKQTQYHFDYNKDYFYLFVESSIYSTMSEDFLEKFIRISKDTFSIEEKAGVIQPNIHQLEKNNSLAWNTNSSIIDFIIKECFLIRGAILKNFQFKNEILNSKMKFLEFAENILNHGYSSLILNNLNLKLPTKFIIPYINEIESSTILSISNKNLTDIGIVLSFIDNIYNGTSEYIFAILPTLINKFHSANISFKIIVDTDKLNKFNFDFCKNYIEKPENLTSVKFSLVYIPHQVYKPEILEFIDQICIKYTFNILDVIALRCKYLNGKNILHDRMELGFRFSDSVLTISDSSKNDILNYFKHFGLKKEIKSILLTQNFNNKNSSIIQSDKILIIGNGFHHKSIGKILPFLSSHKEKITVLADELLKKQFSDKFNIKISGSISASKIEEIFNEAGIVIFPSIYEGFGLPILKAYLLGKFVLVYNNEVNHELVSKFNLSTERIYFFDLYEEIPNLVEIFNKQNPINSFEYIPSNTRSWEDVASETFLYLKSSLYRPIDFENYIFRSKYFKSKQPSFNYGSLKVELYLFLKIIIYFLVRLKKSFFYRIQKYVSY
jgi:hypothetical protein